MPNCEDIGAPVDKKPKETVNYFEMGAIQPNTGKLKKGKLQNF